MVEPEITIEQGTLRGSTGTDIRGNTFFKFQGIPYARPPLGKYRFKAPEPPEKWSGTFDATIEGDACCAGDFFKQGVISGSENCLFLNVFTKTVSSDEKNLSPVLFYIHGGGFVVGSSKEDYHGPDFLITENIVLVTINYRLGLLGFLSFDDPTLEAPGNNGLKDQVQALRWVQKNISIFGGDPNNVTIFGESAEGASVHLLMLSPLAKGLFYKAIAQSGSALNPWVQGTRGAKFVATAMNLEGADDRTIYNALMAMPVEELYKIQQKILDEALVPGKQRSLGVVIEKNAKEAFLAEDPINIMLSGTFNQVPLIIGYCSDEGMIFDALRKPGDPEILPLQDVVPWFFGYQHGTPEIEAVTDKIKKFYFGGEDYSEKSVTKKNDMYSDALFIYGIYVAVISQFSISKAPTFVFRLSLDTNLNFFKRLINSELPGTSHGDDIGYLFKHFATPEIKSDSIEDISLRRILKLWTNFAKFGNPTPEENDELLKAVWKPVTGPNLDFLDIGNDLVPRSNPEAERMKFWSKLFADSPAGRKTECLNLASSV